MFQGPSSAFHDFVITCKRCSEDLAARIPLGWEHINLIGDYQWKGTRSDFSEVGPA
ncbi:hypothetical protein ACPOL_0810 [Acidisarcina polymorpha]|uniref:Mobile element protein n=1 Tax=Acidisarcina polymorpha TaxID=2211140 RepID=A0A2Z5FTL3_9BACT|nr:hypothetical protein ACPOL_0810 [Acidisarcina polymorpha]